MKVPYELQVFR